MDSEFKTEICDKYCQRCDEFTDILEQSYDCRIMLCNECNEKYDNKTGYCSVDCCVSGNCDQTC